MPKVWTLEQRGISRPAPASARSQMREAEQARPKPVATGTSRPRTVTRGQAVSAGDEPERPPSESQDRREPSLPHCSKVSDSGSPRLQWTTEGKVAVFGPNPMLAITIEQLTAEGGDDIHLHAAGQGVWVARMAAELGARPVLCGFIGGETGTVLRPLLERDASRAAPGRDERRPAAAYLHDRRSGERDPDRAERQPAPLPARDRRPLLPLACAVALDADVLALCGPYPAEMLPLEIYGNLVTDVRANGTPVVVDLSPPAPRQRPGGRAGPGQDQRLGAGQIHRGAGRQRGEAA